MTVGVRHGRGRLEGRVGWEGGGVVVGVGCDPYAGCFVWELWSGLS